ncbi:ATP-binding protein [Sunxiuqinia sp. A32]|uniref:ATP-binding protein n=1 Tax=Sunxiuqinia sp. A32 TaxID=3461496 RepID=UPI0040463F3F
MKKDIVSFIKRGLSTITALATFSILLLGSYQYSNYRQGVWEKDIRANLQETLISKKSALEKALYSRIYYTRGVAAYVSMHPEIKEDEYAQLAREFIQDDPVISTMALSKNGIITFIYPKKGHESAIGLNLLEHPERQQIVEKTIETHNTFVAGPVDLVEGGIAFISYTPIFNQQDGDENIFWGMTDIVIHKDKLLKEAGLKNADSDYIYALRGYNGLGNEGKIFWGDEKIFEATPVTINIELPTGSWVLASIPNNGWNSYVDQDKTLLIILLASSFIISILLGLFANALIRIRRNEKELTAIFRSMNSLIIELNDKGEYLKIAPTNKSLLVKPEEQLLGKSLYDIFEIEQAKQFHDAILKCLKEKDIITITYNLKINGKTQWFSAQISNKSEDTVIFNANDITELKNHEENILKTSKELTETNAMKDKFFSIIAHDLRGPITSYKSLTDILLQNYKDITDDEKIELISNMQQSSSDIADLLENLLSWANSQNGRLNIQKQPTQLKELVNSVLPAYEANSELKQVKINNKIPAEATANLDIDATKVILRNLISNAIKFSREKGQVEIYSEESEHSITIIIRDSGVGIPEYRIKNLFQFDQTQSTRGTHGEKGTGFGLILCKEFAEKQGGSIKIESDSAGTSILLTFPL